MKRTTIQIITAASLLAATACQPSRRAVAPKAGIEVGADGRKFVKVRDAGRAGPGGAANRELWQPLGAQGVGRPAYIKKLEPAGLNAPPIFIRVADL